MNFSQNVIYKGYFLLQILTQDSDILGVTITPKPNDLFIGIYLWGKIEREVREVWTSLPNSFFGRINIIKMNIQYQLNYYFQFKYYFSSSVF